MKMNYELPNYEINYIVGQMIMHSPVSNKSNRGVSYEHIATKYVDITVCALLDAFDPELSRNQYRIWLAPLRDQHTNKYGTRRWYDFLREQFPLFDVLDSAHKGSKVGSLVMSKVTVHELLLYAYYNRDRIYNMTQDINHSVAVPIDLRSLKNFVDNNIYYRYKALESNTNQNAIDRYTKNIIDGNKILQLAQQNNGVLHQSVSNSKWPRQYLSGVNIQTSVRSETRNAALGKCYKYDINSSAIAFMACEIIKAYAHTPTAMTQLLNNKQGIRKLLAYDVFKHSAVSAEFAEKLIKSAITSLGFGSDPNNARGSLSDIIMNPKDRALFQQHEWVKQFEQEVQLYEQLIRDAFPPQMVKQDLEFVLKGSKYNVNSVAAYAYQYVETYIMRTVQNLIGTENVLLWVHDCFYSEKKIDPYELDEITAALGYPLMKFSRERIDPIDYNMMSTELGVILQQQHRDRIVQEELFAAQYTSAFVDIDTGNVAKHHIPYPQTNDDELTVLWEEHQQQQLRNINPLYTKE